jgi:phosphoglycolate phosphatase
MYCRAVVFDLDGTLLDTLADIALSANRVLEVRGFPTHEIDTYRYFVGDGVEMLFRRALPIQAQNPDVISACGNDFRKIYAHNWNVHTRPYAGIPELVDALTARGLEMAVLSNKPHDATERCVDEYFPPGTFRVVLGQRDGIPRKPDPAGALEIADRLAVTPQETVLLGDTATDMTTARNAGMYAVGALWGFRPVRELRDAGARAVIEHPMNLMKILDPPPTAPP